MDNQKDTKKTGINSFRQNSFSGVNTLLNKPIYDFANKKTEKLVTALYMVTDCMEIEDALKEKLRLLGVDLMSNIYKLSTLLPMEKHIHINLSLNYIYEILSFVEVAGNIGYISEMNIDILKREFTVLIDELESHQDKNKNFTFTLDEKTLKVEKKENDLLLKGQFSNNDLNKYRSIKDKRTSEMSLMNKKMSFNNVLNKSLSHIDIKKIKSDRVEKILKFIKDKKESETGDEGVSIKDISAIFFDCSEKTVQRELNNLIIKGQIKKTGSKRWSRYLLVSN